MKGGFLRVAACLTLAACSAQSPTLDEALRDSTPSQWTGGPHASSNLEAEWWRGFDDQRLEDVVVEALRYNHDLQAAEARLRAAAAQARIATATLFPTLGLSSDASRRRQVFVGFDDFLGAGGEGGGQRSVVGSTSNQFGVSLDVSWEIDLWGRLRAGRKRAQTEAQAVAADVAAARLSLAGQAAKAWFAVAAAAQQLELAEATVESYSRTAAQVERRYDRGLRSPLDVRSARAELAGSQALVAQRRQQFDAAIRQLEILLGRYPNATLASGALLAPSPEAVPAGIPADLVARRPDLVAAEQRLESAGAAVAESRAALLPRFSLTASGGSTSGDLEDLLDGDFGVWTLAANLAQPLFQGGRLRAGVDVAEARKDEAIARYASVALRAYAEVETALAAETQLGERERYRREAAVQSRSARQLAESRYLSGLEQYVTVLDAHRRELVDESALISVRRERLESRIDLYLALGGGFRSAPLAAPSTEESRS